MIKACIFDAYGTLFDVAAAARILAAEKGRESFAKHWPEISQNWRLKQLQYTWLRAIMEQHTDFWQVTQEGLDYALEASDQTDPELRAALLALYWELPAYPEVREMLTRLRSMGQSTGILSNGSPDMLMGAVNSADIGALLDATISVEDVGVFKPAAPVYQLVLDKFNVVPNEVLFVSSNGWDVAGASGFGFTTLWVNRAKDPIDRLPFAPHKIISDLRTVPEIVKEFS
ncbi:haloacid dehalogenase [Amylibacter marinus]|uniref:(S)-2-haloacid dehalogenase n=1 Tax=Amylibacter marinus TaxID=1475483 RepID=A0ABQ5VR34_9RHOB|nr:haloacid dehalogenase type II [Amylibacter marinus]GLQ33731.1 haloacid dehalogenase [Amylibacter marinus]